MQLTIVENMASGAALLSQEQLQTLARTAEILGKGMEEVTWDVTNYLKQLPDLSPTALEAATCEAVKQWMDRVADAVEAYGPSTTGQEALKLAMQQDRENPVDRSIQILELTLCDVLQTLEKMADNEEWTPARRQERLEEICDPMETLIRSATATRQDTSVTAWVTQVRTLADEVVERQAGDRGPEY